MDKFFLDTNIIIYSFDKSSRKKKNISVELIDNALSTGQGVISHQVIQEFVSVAISKFKKNFNAEKLTIFFEEVMFPLWKAYPDREMYISALQIQDKYQLSWWDSLIVASALITGCNKLYTEDLQHGLQCHTLKIINPYLS